MKCNEPDRLTTSGKLPLPCAYEVTMRLDESLPLETEEWVSIEHMLARLTEFAPSEMLVNLTSAIASFADDQARRAYILGQEDLRLQMQQKAA